MKIPENLWLQDIKKTEYIFLAVKSIAVILLITYVFYESFLPIFFMIPIWVIYARDGLRDLCRKKEKEFRVQFSNAIQAMGAALKAGYSVENAIREAEKDPVYVKAGMIAVISIIIFGCVYSKDNGKKLEKDEKGREILRRNESGKDELKNMKVKIDEKQEDISEYPDSDEKNRSLDYEIEYIISGKSSDKENLESVVTKIFFIRMALNYVYLMGDSVKKSEAMALAATISTLLLIPEAAEAVKQLILLAWAAGEGVIDIRSLLSGNKVPLVKTSDNWQLTLASLFTLGIGDDGISGADAEEGITYKEYLRAFLFLQPEEETTMRTIDRIEENMRLEQNCEKFRADHCVTKCEIRNKVEIFGDLAYTFPSYYGYE